MKNKGPWLHLPRRRFLQGIGAGALILPFASHRVLAEPSSSSLFTLGVASGDPDHRSVILWTRIAPGPLALGGGSRGAPVDGRWQVAAGVFSADGIDPGSCMLAAALPRTLSGQIADLGAGWGFLAGSALENCPKISSLHLVEAQASALSCAKRNVSDPRARFHWADAIAWTGADRLDAVIMNPPFHTGRKADMSLGQSFVQSAARLLRKKGDMWMVANRHLKYEPAIIDHFGGFEEIAGDTRYKVLHARKMQ